MNVAAAAVRALILIAGTHGASAAPWPPAGLDADTVSRVERGEHVEKSKLVGDVVRYSFAARIDASLASVSAAARDLCAAAKRDPKAKVRYVASAGVEAFLASSSGAQPDLASPVLRALPSVSCQAAGTLARVYVIVESEPGFPLPSSTSLHRQDVSVDGADGTLTFRLSQIASTLGGTWDSELRYMALGDANGKRTAYVTTTRVGVPPFVPRFIVEHMLNVPDDENPQLKYLAWLRARAGANDAATAGAAVGAAGDGAVISVNSVARAAR